MKKSPAILFIIATIFVILVFIPRVDAFEAFSSFDTGFDGWTSNNPTAISWSSTGGNPEGYIHFEDNMNLGSDQIIAPSEFLGDWSTLDGIGSISYDYN